MRQPMTIRLAVRPTRRVSGFTLVEVLVAMLVMAIMAGMAWQGVDGIVRTRNATQARLEQTLRLNTVVAQWDQDLGAIQDSAVVPQSLACDGATVRLTRRTPTGLQIVAWSLRADVDRADRAVWVRWASPVATTQRELQESWLRSQQLQDDDPATLRVLTGLRSWQVYFFQGNGWANCQSTGDLVVTAVETPIPIPPPPPAPASNPAIPANPASSAPMPAPVRVALPKGVRVVLTFADGSGISGDLTRDTLLGL